MSNKRIIIAGAGLIGLTLGIYLARKNYHVHIYESARAPTKQKELNHGKSLNLDISYRGIQGLKDLDIYDSFLSHCHQMFGTQFHLSKDETIDEPYSQNQDEFIYNIPRETLYHIIYERTKAYPLIKCYFDHKIGTVDFKQNQLQVENIKTGQLITRNYDYLFGSDGAFSSLRTQMSMQGYLNIKHELFQYRYTEVTIPNSGLSTHHTHIWQNNTLPVIGHPNNNQSISLTLFLSKTHLNLIENLNDTEKEAFLKDHQPNLRPYFNIILPKLSVENFHRLNSIYMIPTDKWLNNLNNVMLIGDASHSMLPFLGQGVNCAYYYIRFFKYLMEKESQLSDAINTFIRHAYIDNHAIITQSILAFDKLRKTNDDGLETLSLRKQIQQLLKAHPAFTTPNYLIHFTDLNYRSTLKIRSMLNTLLKQIGQSSYQKNANPLQDRLVKAFIEEVKPINTAREVMI